MPAILVALIFRTLDALRIFDLPYVLTKGAERDDHAVADRAGDVRDEPDLRPRARRMAVLTFIIVMIVSFSYIRFVGGNIRGLAED